ncbi:MAG: alpha/beta fold hydrolase [Tetrasphaera sp.]|nr:alpha/beta fold hydrolase [Tetrasphaera sp.]
MSQVACSPTPAVGGNGTATDGVKPYATGVPGPAIAPESAGHRAGRTLAAAAAVSVGAVTGTGAASIAGAAYFARRVLTPDRRRPDDTIILEAGDGHVVLGVGEETTVDGHYGLWLDGGRGHARVGEILAVDVAAGRVTRRVDGVDEGVLGPGTARWNPYYHWAAPAESLGVPTESVLVDAEVGPMPAWLIPGTDPQRWAILVHGRGARRQECLRAVAPLRATRHTVLIPAYRNDEDAPPGPDGRYNLGLSEWRDIDAAMRYAVAHGARDLTLVGWSMGGAIVLQTLDRSDSAGLVGTVVLDGPVVDWADVLRFHARENHVPESIHRLSTTLMGRQWSRRLVGVHEAVDVARTNWVARAGELRHRMLLIHSRDDEFVPFGPSLELAQARPDLITWVPWETARHCKEWNTDPRRWEDAVVDFLTTSLLSGRG